MRSRAAATRLIGSLLAAIACSVWAVSAAAQTDARGGATGWRTPQDEGGRYSAPQGGAAASPSARQAAAPPAGQPVTPVRPVPGGGPTRARVSKGSGTLPNEHGQVWREYDISPYTLRVSTTNRPQQAVVDWILRETGYEAWHGVPLGILSANESTLRVYHTPEIQSIVADIVDRFVNSQAEAQAFGLRIVTVQNPNWRGRALRLMRPVPVQSPGVQGWLIAKEDAALLIAELRKRTDFREHNSPQLMVHNGQSTVVSTMRQRTYSKGIVLNASAWPGYQPEMGLVDEGFSLEFNPLVSLDGQTVDAVVKLRLNQIEKMVPIMLDVPTAAAPNQQVQVEVPQLTMCDLHERFRWPVDEVLLLSMGVVATPEPQRMNVLTAALPMLRSPPRADALLFIESKGRTETIESAAATARRAGPIFQGRY
jgi:hypothetical protein